MVGDGTRWIGGRQGSGGGGEEEGVVVAVHCGQGWGGQGWGRDGIDSRGNLTGRAAPS